VPVEKAGFEGFSPPEGTGAREGADRTEPRPVVSKHNVCERKANPVVLNKEYWESKIPFRFYIAARAAYIKE
jgi:hypothetical protein